MHSSPCITTSVRAQPHQRNPDLEALKEPECLLARLVRRRAGTMRLELDHFLRRFWALELHPDLHGAGTRRGAMLLQMDKFFPALRTLYAGKVTDL